MKIPKWHKTLLFKMTVSVGRKYLSSQNFFAELDEYLSFRHVFRNIYGFELKGEGIYLARKFDKMQINSLKKLGRSSVSLIKK